MFILKLFQAILIICTSTIQSISIITFTQDLYINKSKNNEIPWQPSWISRWPSDTSLENHLIELIDLTNICLDT